MFLGGAMDTLCEGTCGGDFAILFCFSGFLVASGLVLLQVGKDNGHGRWLAT